MLLPTQQSAGLAATNMMQSMIDSAEKRRIEDEEKIKGKKDDPVLKARMSSDVAQQRAREKIETYLFDSGHVSTNELKMQLIDKLGMAMELKKEDDESGFSYGKKLESMLSKMDYAAKRALEKEVGLDDLDISIDTMIAAIKNPYADDNERLEAALEKQAGGGKDSHVAQSKVLQRLESIANPKTAEELKLEPTINDPTRVEDEEVRQERAEDIRGKQAMEKLDDVKDIQKAVKENHDEAVKADNKGEAGETEPSAAVADSLDMIQVLVAAADASKASDEQADAANNVDAETDKTDPKDAAKSAQAEAGIEPTPEADIKPGDQPEKPILTLYVDEIGIYDLLKPKKAA